MMQLAPAIHVPRKSVAGPLDEDRAFKRAVHASRGIDVPLPVVWRGRVLGWVMGERAPSPHVHWRRDPMRLGWTTYADLLSERTKNKKLATAWHKEATASHTANCWYDLWPCQGLPGAGAYGGTAYTAKRHDDTEAGSLFLGGNVSTDTKHVTSVWGSSSDRAVLLFYDRVLTYEACSFNASVNQSMTNGVAALRYIAAGEPGLKIMVTVESALGATPSDFTQLRYTDQEGNATQSMPTTVTVSHIVSASAPSTTLGAQVVAPADSGAALPWGPFMPLAFGDTGVRLINDFTTSAANTGTLTFTLLYPIAMVPITTFGLGTNEDEILMRNRLPRIYDGACISAIVRPGDTSGRITSGGMEVSWG